MSAYDHVRSSSEIVQNEFKRLGITSTVENGCLQSLDWTSKLDWWTGLVDWTSGLTLTLILSFLTIVVLCRNPVAFSLSAFVQITYYTAIVKVFVSSSHIDNLTSVKMMFAINCSVVITP